MSATPITSWDPVHILPKLLDPSQSSVIPPCPTRPAPAIVTRHPFVRQPATPRSVTRTNQSILLILVLFLTKTLDASTSITEQNREQATPGVPAFRAYTTDTNAEQKGSGGLLGSLKEWDLEHYQLGRKAVQQAILESQNFREALNIN
ncbi:MAG: hypothetical protein TREMPRED_001279 [Tremellales sp. Tagirdzhanova-0007]|nr:MAG: hypothetical protein TREMPRED_001279 [Tremellales sp. Tagirdzhanova-0007]